MKMTECAFVQGMVRLCEDGWLQGWHERNGGNVTSEPPVGKRKEYDEHGEEKLNSR